MGGAQQPRARQSVILELGYFIGRFTRGRVCALKVGDLRIAIRHFSVSYGRLSRMGRCPGKSPWPKEFGRQRATRYDWNKVMA